MDKIIKKINIKRVTLLSILVVLAIFAFITRWPMVGSVLILIAVILSFLNLHSLYYRVTGSPIKSSTYYFEGERRAELIRAFDGKLQGELPSIEFGVRGSGKVELLISRDRKFAQVTIWHYVPHAYKQIGNPIIFENEELKPLVALLGIEA